MQYQEVQFVKVSANLSLNYGTLIVPSRALIDGPDRVVSLSVPYMRRPANCYHGSDIMLTAKNS